MRIILLLLLSAVIFGCQSNKSADTEKSAFNIDSVKAHIMKMNESYSERFMSNDPGFYSDRYCADAQVYSPGMPAVMGRDSIRSFFYNNGNNKEAKIDLPPGNFYGNEDLVVEDGTYSFPDGKGGSVDKGKFIAIWKKEEGKWKLYREIWNTDLPPASSSK
jgi:ketosteroid isomerase-like protein